jgi:hypothetical protein
MNKSRPNAVLITTGRHNARVLGCEDHPFVQIVAYSLSFCYIVGQSHE